MSWNTNFKGGIIILLTLVIVFILFSIPFTINYLYKYSYPILKENLYEVKKMKIDTIEIQEVYASRDMETNYIYHFYHNRLTIPIENRDFFNRINPKPSDINNFLKNNNDTIFVWFLNNKPYKFSFYKQNTMNTKNEHKNIRLLFITLIVELIILSITLKFIKKYFI